MTMGIYIYSCSLSKGFECGWCYSGMMKIYHMSRYFCIISVIVYAMYVSFFNPRVWRYIVSILDCKYMNDGRYISDIQVDISSSGYLKSSKNWMMSQLIRVNSRNSTSKSLISILLYFWYFSSFWCYYRLFHTVSERFMIPIDNCGV